MTQLEFWPDYGKGPLWTERGTAVALDEIALLTDLAERLRAWNRQYSEEKIPIDGAGDAAWLREGTDLLRRTRGRLDRATRSSSLNHGGARNQDVTPA